MSSGERRLAAIMFTDMVGYTALGQRNEALSLALVEEQRKLIRPLLGRHKGREVKTIGDAFLVEFPSAVDAVRCAYDIQRAAREFGLSLPRESRIRLRVGVHLGEVLESQGDISGDAVNVASRIEPLAEEGGVCVSRPVYDQVRGKVDLPLVSIGSRELKNVAEPMEVFRMTMPWGTGAASEGAGALDPRRIAVLPFVSLSPDPNDEYFADGLTEELITRVSFVKGLEVIARTSVMNYKRKEKNASEIARELRVGTLLEGSVRKAGNRIRITAQLINAGTEGHLWAQSYDRNLDDIFEVQSSVAENVAGALKLQLLKDTPEGGAEKADPEAYTMYLRGVEEMGKGMERNLMRARTLFEGAVAKDPSFARSYAALARTLWYLAATAADRAGTMERAEEAARKALEIAPNSAEAHVAMADVHTALDRFGQGKEELEKAIRINPNLAVAYDLLATTYLTLGKKEEGVAAFRKAYSLDPLSARQGNALVQALRVTGAVGESMALAERLKVLHPGSPIPFLEQYACNLQNGDLAEATKSLDRALEVDPGISQAPVYRGMVYAKEGRRKEAEEALESLKSSPRGVYTTGAIVIRSELGDLDEAMDMQMEEAEVHAWYAFVLLDPLYAKLRSHPRFPEFCKMVGLPPP